MILKAHRGSTKALMSSGFTALLLANLVLLGPRFGVPVGERAHDVLSGLLYGIAFGLLLLSLWSARRRT